MNNYRFYRMWVHFVCRGCSKVKNSNWLLGNLDCDKYFSWQRDACIKKEYLYQLQFFKMYCLLTGRYCKLEFILFEMVNCHYFVIERPRNR